MEDLLKFVTTEQSRRSEAFMFFWRLLMAVLLTNHKMNELGYHFVNKDIGLHTIIDFLFSTAFFYASFWYLIFIFLFFWGMKVLVFIEILLLNSFNIILSENYLLELFSFFGIFSTENKKWYVKDRKGLELLQRLCMELNSKKSTIKENLYTIVNIIISTYFWYNKLGASVNFPFWIDRIFCALMIIGIMQILGFFWLMTTGGNLHRMLIEYKRKGFLVS